MYTKQNYGGLDIFRLIAAFLVITIHTSPLASLNASADFFLKDVLARLAVPFFFMVTGQFVLSDYLLNYWPGCKEGHAKKVTKIWRYLKKVALLYAVTILIYLPVGIYTGRYVGMTPRLAFQMLVFDGTFYHLWYFPACITGILLVCLFRRILSIRGMAVITGILYLIGLFGDSYYGLIANIPIITSAYEVGFQYFTFTRNGLFLAPIFLLMGAMVGNLNQKHLLHPAVSGIGFTISFLLFAAEAAAVRDLHPEHHDNMYLSLIPCMFFLYQLLLKWDIKVKSARQLRTLSTWVYILHPAIIVLVRIIAELVNITTLLVENRLIRYAAVSFLSVMISWGIMTKRNFFTRSNSYAKKR